MRLRHPSSIFIHVLFPFLWLVLNPLHAQGAHPNGTIAACEAFVLGFQALPQAAEANVRMFRNRLERERSRILNKVREEAEEVGLDTATDISQWHESIGLPRLGKTAREALKLWEVMADDFLADPAIAAERIAGLRRILNQDPFMRWLEMNQDAVAPVSQSFSPFWGDEEKIAGDFRVIAFSPIDLLVAHVTTASRNRLPAVFAWLRVVRDFDPTLTDDLRNRIDLSLEDYKAVVATRSIFQRVEAIQNPIIWAMATNSTVVWTNLFVLEDLIRGHFGAFFPEALWKQVRSLVDSDAAEVRAVIEASLQYKSDPTEANRKQLDRAIEVLHNAVGAPETVNRLNLLEATRRRYCGRDGYIDFLLNTVPEISQGFNYPNLAGLYRDLGAVATVAANLDARKFTNLRTQELQCLRLSY